MKTAIKPSRRRVREIYLTNGGRPALDFINTCKRDSKGNWTDRLTNYSTFLNWCEDIHLIEEDRWTELDFEQYCCVKEAEMVYCEARSARDCFDELFNYLVSGENIHPLILDRFNAHADKIRPHLKYMISPRGAELCWFGIQEELNLPLWLLIADACRLIDSGDWRKMKKCPVCGSLFIDNSRSNNRRWCNVNTCGSLGRSKKYYTNKIMRKIELKIA